MQKQEIINLYSALIKAWNERDAIAFANLFTDGAIVVGFDGSSMQGSDEIKEQLTHIFSNHKTAPYVYKVKDVRFITDGISILQSIVGMPKSEKKEINPQVNAIQNLVAAKVDGEWKIELFQNTPAQFHGRPELIEQMTAELNELL